MILTESKSQIEIPNPYLPSSSVSKQEAFLHAQMRPYTEEEDKVIQLADQIVDWGKKAFYSDYEKQIDLAGLGARILDWGVFIPEVALQGLVIADNVFRFNSSGILRRIPFALKCIAVPLSVFFLIAGLIEAAAEVVNLKRSITFLTGLNRDDSLLQKLTWIRHKYFILDGSEAKKIFNYLESHLPPLSQEGKALRFEKLAEKALEIQYSALERRVTPGLSKQLAEELPEVIQGLTSPDKEEYEIATERGKLLIGSLNRQSKVKVLAHVLALSAIALTVVSMIGVFLGVAASAFFITLGVISAALTFASFLLDRGVANTEGARLYDKLASIPHIMGAAKHPLAS